MNNKYLKTNKGFTIIEMMIAIALFLIIVMTGMGALLNANLIHNKSKDVRSILDNMSFIMEDMSRNLRTGYNYHCVDRLALPSNFDASDCITGNGKELAFEEAHGDIADSGDQWVYGISSGGYIWKSTDGADTFSILTPEEVEIDETRSGFYVFGALPTDDQQPFVIIRLAGEIRYKDTVTPFDLQTSVSQRLIDYAP